MSDTSESLVINVRGSYFVASNAITNEFGKDYYIINRFLDSGIKGRVSEKLKDRNYLSIEAGGELAFKFRPDSVHRGLQAFVSLRQRNNIDADFARDAFELVFNGNKMYAGKTANLSNSKSQYISYWQLALGLGNEYKCKNGTLSLAANVDINSGIKFLKLQTNNASLYTEPTGEFIDATLNGMIQTNDSASSKATSNNGVGFSGDFYAEYKKDNYAINVSAENIGYIQWNKFSTEITMDTSFHFDGAEVRDLFNFSDSVKAHVAFDSTYYYNFINHRKEKRITTNLPYKFSASYSRYYINRRLIATIGVDFLHSTHSAERFFAAASYKVHHDNEIGLILADRTDIGFQGGLSYVHLFPKHFRFEIGSSYLFSMINYNAGTKQGAYVAIAKGF